jgi:polysaccharide biosynthesis/export protein
MKNSIMSIASTTFAVLLCASAAAFAEGQQPARPAGTTPTAPAPVGTSGAAAAANTDYRLVPGDKLRIQVYKDDKLSQDLQVRPDGKITLPLVGDLSASGRTSTELRDAIARSLTEYGSHSNPVVTVIVVETVPPTIYVMGEVKSPGAQALKGELTVLQALASAGGMTEWAKKKVRVLRKSTTGLTTTLDFNYKDAMKGVGKQLVLQPGDTIIVE